MSAVNSERPLDIVTFDAGIELLDLGDHFTLGCNLQVTSPTGEGAWMTGGATDHSATEQLRQVRALPGHAYTQELGSPIINEAAPDMQGYFPDTIAEGSDSFLGLYDSVPDSSRGRLLGEASTFGDWPALFDEHLIDSSVENGFYSQMPPQLDPFLTQPSYPTVGFGQAFQPIAPAPAAAVPPNIMAAPSRALPVARRRTVEPRFQCNIDGCTRAYRRVGDCRRHMRSHRAPNLRCVVEGCHMKFDRMDKLRDHVRQGHKMNL